MAWASASFDPALPALNSDVASAASSEANAASGIAAAASSRIAESSGTWEAAAGVKGAAASSRIAESSATWETTTSKEIYRVASGATITIANDEQFIIHEEYVLDGAGELTINGAGRFICIDF